MGKPKYIYFRDDIHELLSKEDNASKLINDLLDGYFKERDLDDMTEEQLETELAIANMEQELKDRVKELRDGH